MCLAQGPQRSDAGEARTRGPSVSSQALYHCAPLDRSMFCLFQRIYNGICSQLMTSKTTAMVNRVTFLGLMNQAYVQSFSRTKNKLSTDHPLKWVINKIESTKSAPSFASNRENDLGEVNPSSPDDPRPFN